MNLPGTFRVGSLLGIPLQINVSWFVAFGLITVSLVAGQLPDMYPRWDETTLMVVGVTTSLLFFVSVVLHELAHSAIAQMIGIPVRSITLFIFGGVAHIARDPAEPAGELLMAAMGPVASFALAAGFAALWAAARDVHEPITAMAGLLAGINFSLGAFNLIPGFPLDGGRVLRSILWWGTGSHRTATHIAGWFGRSLALFLIVLGVALAMSRPGAMLSGVWMIAVGWFVNQAVTGNMRQLRFRESLNGYVASDLMASNLHLLPPGLTIQEAVNRFFGATGWRWFLVAEGNTLRGLVTLSDISRVPKREWSNTLVRSVMTAADDLTTVAPDWPAPDVLDAMQEKGYQQTPVVQDGQLLGVVTAVNLFEAAHTRRELGF
ncbi:MAG: site-2 protease family protein [Dehalococcoidia bacterium]|nr:site-2 protease family protein [Dehalococcoidia bacterium]